MIYKYCGVYSLFYQYMGNVVLENNVEKYICVLKNVSNYLEIMWTFQGTSLYKVVMVDKKLLISLMSR